MRAVLFFAAVVATALLLEHVSAATIAEKLPYRYEAALRASKYCRASYCASSAVIDWSCGSICTAVPDFKPYKLLQNASMDVFGFTGVDPAHQQIVVAFRGTSSVTNWLEDFNYFFTAYDPESDCGVDCKVHEGFFGVYNSVRAQARAAVSELLQEFPDYQILVAGHSLGGVTALLCAVDLQERLNNAGSNSTVVSLYTLGAPRAGNLAFATWASQILGNDAHYRITHRRDPVPHLPPMSFGFLHAPTEVFYRTNANSSMRVCADTTTAEDSSCSDDMYAIVITDHLEYLGDSTRCSGSLEAQEQPRLPLRLRLRLTHEYLRHKLSVLLRK